MWHELLHHGMKISDLKDVAPGDVVFLTCTATPYLAFTVHAVTRRNGLTLLYLNDYQHYVIGGSSTSTFTTALRPSNHLPQEERA